MHFLKKSVSILFVACSFTAFAQNDSIPEVPVVPEVRMSYLDSIKSTFVYDNMASCVDSLWVKELTNIDLYETMSSDIRSFDLDSKVDFELSTDLLKARLKEMDARSPFNIEYNPGLENIIKNFLKNRKRSYERLMALAEYYFPIFEQALAKYNVPLEIKYLAIVESALNPKAVSKAGATGLWQFMYGTGKQYNLRIDSYVDERSDVLKASEAAAQYMYNMYKIFGDWDLVLASYNAGPGNVSKAIRRSGGQQNYWNIRRNLPQETQGYVPAFLATMYIFEYHKEHGIVPQRANVRHFETDTVMIKSQLSFKQISDLLDISVSELRLLNPSYKLDVVPAYHNQKHFLRLPLDKMAIFTSNEEKVYAYAAYQESLREKPFTYPANSAIASGNATYKTQTSTKYHKVKKGESLGVIAKKYGVSVTNLKKWNGLKSNTVAAGRSLKIQTTTRVAVAVPDNTAIAVASPKKANAASAESKEVASKEATVKEGDADTTAKTHVVKAGETLSEIAKKHDIALADLKEWNDLESDQIKVGTTLQLLAVEEKPEVKVQIHKVAKGETIAKIAREFQVTVTDIKAWNNLESDNILVGAELKIHSDTVAPKSTAVAASSKNTKTQVAKENTYLVKSGDSLYSISQKFPGVSISDLRRWNGSKANNLKPGMRIRVSG